MSFKNNNAISTCELVLDNMVATIIVSKDCKLFISVTEDNKSPSKKFVHSIKEYFQSTIPLGLMNNG